MSWESITGIATRTHLRIFGVEVSLYLNNGNAINTKAIISPHMTHLREHHGDMESYALIASVSKKDIKLPEYVQAIETSNKQYQIVKYKYEPDGFYVFFLSE